MELRHFTPKPMDEEDTLAERLLAIGLSNGLGITREIFIDEGARYMAFVAWKDTGCSGLPNWHDLQPMAKDRYRQHFSRACRLLNSEVKLQAMKDAIESTVNWHGAENPVTPAQLGDVLLHALMDFDYLLGKVDQS